jgi:hypothetical protein
VLGDGDSSTGSLQEWDELIALAEDGPWPGDNLRIIKAQLDLACKLLAGITHTSPVVIEGLTARRDYVDQLLEGMPRD